MSLEGSLAECAISLTSAGMSCAEALETGGIFAYECALEVVEAANDCNDAADQLYEKYQKEQADKLPEKDVPQETKPEDHLDPHAKSDESWTIFYQAGKDNFSTPNLFPAKPAGDIFQTIFGKERKIDIATKTATFKTQVFTPTSLSEGKAALLKILKQWVNWESAVRDLKVTDIEQAKSLSECINNARKVIAHQKALEAFKVP